MVPYAGISFGTFETLKEMAIKLNHPFMCYTIEYNGKEMTKLNWYVHSGAGSGFLFNPQADFCAIFCWFYRA